MLRFWSSKLDFWRKSRRHASFLIFKAWFLKEVSQTCFIFDLQSLILKEVPQKCFIFDLQIFIFEGSLADMLRSWLQSLISERSLADMLRFWSSKLDFWRKSRRHASFLIFKAWFWRKSRRNASFLIFKAWFLKEVSQKCFIFDLQSLIFEGSLAEKLRFWTSRFQFWGKSRRKASVLLAFCDVSVKLRSLLVS